MRKEAALFLSMALTVGMMCRQWDCRDVRGEYCGTANGRKDGAKQQHKF